MTVRDVREGFTDFVNWALDPRPRIGLGLPFFDQFTNGGIARSEIAMVMAFSSVGKTSIGLNILKANPTLPAMFFSLEMSWRQVVNRLAAMTFGTTTRAIEREVMETRDVPQVVHDTVQRYPLLVCDDTPAITLKDASVSFHRATERLGMPPRLVMFDYLELIGGSGLLGKAEAVDRASQKLRDWARQHDTAVIVLHQVGKGEGGDVPLDLGSGRYGGFAPMDFVVGAYAPRLRNGITSAEFESCKSDLFLQLLKNRAGAARPAGVRHTFDPDTMDIRPYGTFGPILGTQGVLS